MSERYARIRSGSVIRYPYLWDRQASRGETEGRKERPTAVAVRLSGREGDRLVLLAITSSEPAMDRRAVEIPDREKKRAGLSGDLRLWIVVDEANIDVIGRSFYLRDEPPLGEFGRSFFRSVLRAMLASRSLRQVGRT